MKKVKIALTAATTAMFLPQTARAGGSFGAKPDPSKLPGDNVLGLLRDGILGWVLILSLIALAASALSWAFGQQMSHHTAQSRGKMGVMISAAVALFVGAGPAAIEGLYNLGQQATP